MKYGIQNLLSFIKIAFIKEKNKSILCQVKRLENIPLKTFRHLQCLFRLFFPVYFRGVLTFIKPKITNLTLALFYHQQDFDKLFFKNECKNNKPNRKISNFVVIHQESAFLPSEDVPVTPLYEAVTKNLLVCDSGWTEALQAVLLHLVCVFFLLCLVT